MQLNQAFIFEVLLGLHQQQHFICTYLPEMSLHENKSRENL